MADGDFTTHYKRSRGGITSMKKILSMVCLCLTVMLFVGNAAAEGAALTTADLKIGIIMKSFDEYQNNMISGATDEAVSEGVKKENIIALAPKNEHSEQEQVQMIENCVAQGVNILILSSQTPDAVTVPLQEASAKGIKVVSVDTDAPYFKDPNKVTFVGLDNYTAAHDGAAEFIKRYMQPGENMVIIRGKLGDTNHDARTKGMEDACKEAGINMLEAQDANSEPEKAANIMQNFITKYGDTINSVLVTSDNHTTAAVTSIAAANLTDEILVCGFDGMQPVVKAVGDGAVKMIIAQSPYWMGQTACKYGIAALLEGQTFEPHIVVPNVYIDSDNYKEFLK
jgi:ribose transport system substrate-binding protein